MTKKDNVVTGPWGQNKFKALPHKIGIGTAEHAYLSAHYIVARLTEAGVEAVSVVLLHDGSGWFQIPYTRKNTRMGWSDWTQIFELIGSYVHFNVDHGKSADELPKPITEPAPMVPVPKLDPRVRWLPPEDLTMDRGEPLLWREIGIKFTYQMKNFTRFAVAARLELKFDAALQVPSEAPEDQDV